MTPTAWPEGYSHLMAQLRFTYARLSHSVVVQASVFRRSRPYTIIAIIFVIVFLLMFRPILLPLVVSTWGSSLRAMRRDPAIIHVAVMHGFGSLSAAAMLDELWFIGRLFPSTRPLVGVPDWLPREVQFAAADLVLVSVYGDRSDLVAVRKAHPRAAFLFVSGENLALQANLIWWDHFIDGGADLSMGQRMDGELSDSARKASSHYIRIPWWLPYTLDRTAPGRCPLPLSLFKGEGSSSAWRARPCFATLLSSHYAYPRRGLNEAITPIGRVDAPGKAFHNMEWPSDLQTGHLGGKPAFLTRYRFNICPENSLSMPVGSGGPGGEGGYNTEKVPQALVAGTVPIYWGDPLEAAVWNPARFLRFNGSFKAIAAAVKLLETDSSAADAFFNNPPLLSTAQGWVDSFCGRLGAEFAWLAERIDQRRAGLV